LDWLSLGSEFPSKFRDSFYNIPPFLYDEGTKGKPRAKHKLIPQNPSFPPGEICPQALLTALKLREGKNKWLTNRDHSPARQESP